MKKILNKTYSIFFLIASLFVGVSSFAIKNEPKQLENNNEVVTRSISSSNLKDDIESLSFSVNITDYTLSYDVTFKDKSFNGSEVSSYYFHHDQDAIYNGSEPWVIDEFEGSEETVADKHASNTTYYYDQIKEFSYGEIYTYELDASLGLFYNKGGIKTPATYNPIHLQLDLFNLLLDIDETSSFVVNTEKTVATVGFNYKTDSNLALDSINLKSYSDENLNQTIYSIDDPGDLIPGKNSKSFILLSQYHYYDLYLEFNMSNFQDAHYTYESVISGGIDFVSGEIKTVTEINKVDLIILLIILILIFISIILIVLMIRQMKKRRELEKLQDQSYYDENYEDSIN